MRPVKLLLILLQTMSLFRNGSMLRFSLGTQRISSKFLRLLNNDVDASNIQRIGCPRSIPLSSSSTPLPPQSSSLSNKSPDNIRDAEKIKERDRLVQELLVHVKNKQSNQALRVYEQLKTAGHRLRSNIQLSVLSVCYKIEHLQVAIDMFNDMIESGVPPTEQSYLALIRCHSDGGNVDDAIAFVKHMITIGIEPKIRTYQPILESLCYKMHEPMKALEIIKHMYRQDVHPRSEQLALLLETSGRNVSYLSDPMYRASLNEFIGNSSSNVLGITAKDIATVVSSVSNVHGSNGGRDEMKGKDAQDPGTLLESLETILETPDCMIIDVDVEKRNVWTLNTVQEGVASIYENRRDLPPDCAIVYQKEKYRFLDSDEVHDLVNVSIPLEENNTRFDVAIDEDGAIKSWYALKILLSSDQHLEDDVAREISQLRVARGQRSPVRHEFRIKKSAASRKKDENSRTLPSLSKAPYPLRKAEIVGISNRSCRCPNCGNYLKPMYLTEEERHRVRVALMKIASTSSLNQCKNLQAFSDWLNEQEEFVYIVDGANVAYNKQNFENGKFSYRQIELVVNQIEKDYPGERILVIIPYPYAQRIVPNSVQYNGRRKLTYLADDEIAVLERLQKNNMLYITPQGSDDDWYWMYCTVNEGRKSSSYVVTNDLMRDHRLAFLEPRPFLRWRSNQVLHFEFSKGATNESPNPDVFLIEPERFPREIQRTENGRWHIPATDTRAWLCLDTEAAS